MPITPVSDKTITRQVLAKLAGRGLGSPCRILVETFKGHVTLTGTVQYEQQKASAVRATNGVSGIHNIVERLIVKAVLKH